MPVHALGLAAEPFEEARGVLDLTGRLGQRFALLRGHPALHVGPVRANARLAGVPVLPRGDDDAEAGAGDSRGLHERCEAASATPLTAALVLSAIEAAGVPAGVINLVTSRSSATVAETIFGDARVRKVSFTGSTEVGKELILGGHAPYIIFADADLDEAVTGLVASKSRRSTDTSAARARGRRLRSHRRAVRGRAVAGGGRR